MERIFTEVAQERQTLNVGAVSGSVGITCVMARANVFVFTNENQAHDFRDAWRKGFRPVGLVKWEIHRGENRRCYVVTKTTELDSSAWAKQMLVAAEGEVLELFKEGNLQTALGATP